MDANYDILTEYTSSPNPDTIQLSSRWIVAVIRFARPLTFNRNKLIAGQRVVSFDLDADDIARERPILVLTDDVLSVSVSSSKSSYISSFQAVIANSENNLLAEIQPSDWVMCWMLNDTTHADALAEDIRNQRRPCNDISDGLKFVGRVESIRKNLSQAPDGKRSVRYQLTGVGFKELSSEIFYDPALSQQEDSIGTFLLKLKIGVDDFFTSENEPSISTTKAIPRLLKLLVGEGIPLTSAQPDGVEIAAGPIQTEEAPYAYVIPSTVSALLGKKEKSRAVDSYADILDLLLGLQKYNGKEFLQPDQNGDTGNDTKSSNVNHRILNHDLLGSFLPMPVAFNMTPIWSILHQFLNPAVNEMYTTLRADANGLVVPTIVVRQKPFSTDLFAGRQSEIKCTRFLELPRWRAHPILVNDLNIGKSDAVHHNFIHVYGQAPSDASIPITDQLVKSPPIRDEQDIKRNGLRPYMETVACDINETNGAQNNWMKLVSDFLVGQQFTLNGTCVMVGVQAPICVGDNFEFDGVVYHIESVTHQASILPDGLKSFTTTLNLTHGIDAVGDSTGDHQLSIYSGVGDLDNTGNNPGISTEKLNKKTTPDPISSSDTIAEEP